MAGLLLLIRVFERRESVANLNLELLEQAALTDSLTGLGNHRAYQEELHREVKDALSANTTLSLAVLDIDEFKEINDSQGHARGDQILFQMGRLLREVCSPSDQRFRVGGDEFAVIMPGSDERAAQGLMERFRVLASLTGATVSIGLAQLDPGDDTEILREKADSTLYTAKRRGRNAVCTFSGDNAEQKVVTQSKIQAVRDLLRDDRIDMAFQPVLESGANSIIGYEALARIPDGYDLDGPAEAFEIAERIGHCHDLDLLCIREGLNQAGYLTAGQTLFLNISPRTFEYAGFSAAAIANLVLEAGLKPEQVCFEITENSAVSVEVVQREARALKDCGFRIALDDVGAGASGLEMMRHLGVDFVKIDRSVLLSALEKGPGRGVLLAIIVFASESGAFVIAEGIETPEMLAVIQETNKGPFVVQGIQGFILGGPKELPRTADLELTA
jgi:diguanylate cyclase (GGDEF)-like protein